jgi:hypothetical protein
VALPDFLIIGAQKSGTTWLADQLSRHPLVFMAPEEIHFFDKQHNYRRGVEWYGRFFTEGKGKLIGEKTPDYLWTGVAGAEGHMPDAHRHIRTLLPDSRLLVVLRNPVHRALSALTHMVRTRRVSPGHLVDDLLLGKKRTLIEGHGVIEKGFYHQQLMAYAELFPPEQILVLIFEEDIADRPDRGLDRVCDFLEIHHIPPHVSSGRERNASRRSRLRLLADYYLPPFRPFTRLLDRLGHPWKPVLRRASAETLYGLYRDENARLFEWLGRPMPASWSDPFSDDSSIPTEAPQRALAPAEPRVILGRARQRAPRAGP